MSKDEMDKTRQRILKLVHSVETEVPRDAGNMSWSPFELCSESLDLVQKVIEYAAKISDVLEKKGTADIHENVQQFVGTHVLIAKSVLFHLLKLSYEIRTTKEQSQKHIIEYAVCLQIFEEALQELKIDAEAGYEKAAGALLEVQQLISDQMNRKGCDLDLVFDVINALNDARVNIIEPIKTAMLRLGETEEMEDYHAELPSLDKMVDNLLEDGKSLFEIYDILASPSRAMPLDGRYEFINSLDSVSGAVGRDLLILSCLDKEKDIRKHAISLLLKRRTKDFDSKSLTWLKNISLWDPDADMREAVSTLVRKLKMSGLKPENKSEEPEEIKVVATAFDGSGCQVIFGAMRLQGNLQTFGIMFKQSEGVEDAWVSSHLSEADFKGAIEHAELMPEQYGIDENYLQIALPYFLTKTIENDLTVPNGLLALASILSEKAFLPDSTPMESCIERMSEKLATEAAPKKELTDGFLRLYDRCYNQMWFEEGSDVENIVSDQSINSTEMAIDRLRKEVVEPNLLKWSEKFKLMSMLLFTANKNAGRKWQEFYYIFENLLDAGCPNIEKVMYAISARSHEQMVERMNQ